MYNIEMAIAELKMIALKKSEKKVIERNILLEKIFNDHCLATINARQSHETNHAAAKYFYHYFKQNVKNDSRYTTTIDELNIHDNGLKNRIKSKGYKTIYDLAMIEDIYAISGWGDRTILSLKNYFTENNIFAIWISDIHQKDSLVHSDYSTYTEYLHQLYHYNWPLFTHEINENTTNEIKPNN
jgi:hypothetical protein